MMKVLMAALAVLMLSSCATLKKTFCDCASTTKASGVDHNRASEKAPKEAGKESGIVVESTDLDASNRMSKAVDAYVFKNQKDEFTALCKDERFDCFVNDQRFPKGRKKIKRKVPPFMSGSKMGLQGEDRIRVKYDFYP